MRKMGTDGKKELGLQSNFGKEKKRLMHEARKFKTQPPRGLFNKK